MGATGSGKTTMVNAMINYVLGVKWDDPFRFILVKEDLQGMSQAFSQTREVVAYDIRYREGFRVPYSLTIIDTPGFGDTGGGILHDEKITAAVKKFFEHENGIQELDAVGFVVQSALVRLTSSQTYVFNSVLSIFGKDIEENVRFLVTFADGKKPPVLEAIKQANLPCLKDLNGLPCHQTFNNNSIFESNQTNDRRTLIDWEDGMKNFDLFFTELSKMPTKSLQLTKELLFSREILTNTIAVLESNIQVHLTKMEELRKTEETIDNYKDKIEANKDFTIKIQVPKKVQIKVDSYTALNCSKCETTCHYPCNHWLGITWCPAFWRAVPSIKDKLQIKGKVTTGNVDSKKLFCNVCPQRCGPEHHKNEEKRWIYETKEETQTRYDVQARYEEACEKTLTEEELKKKMLSEIEVLETEIIDDMYEITRCWNELKKNALLDDPLTTPEYIQKMIEKEEEDKRPGYNEKVSNLKNLLKRVQLAQNIAQGGDEVYKIFSH